MAIPRPLVAPVVILAVAVVISLFQMVGIKLQNCGFRCEWTMPCPAPPCPEAKWAHSKPMPIRPTHPGPTSSSHYETEMLRGKIVRYMFCKSIVPAIRMKDYQGEDNGFYLALPFRARAHRGPTVRMFGLAWIPLTKIRLATANMA
ncbi:hypothetical protein E2C01_034921 [Portunus trituberculatus]|uniref:Uncharacterized protein n=1 Tax=Portunus trituberculatus TaxID=210409 RepID=A0A5B7F8B7_PORTR|nr:hypothetical protein [Portunus trituberculatus]